ncbi:MAG: hypothetical protein HY854_14400 [Burkholderiales bacterium]|nr:hypothetical protein [Burkholderiales bacterium]
MAIELMLSYAVPAFDGDVRDGMPDYVMSYLRAPSLRPVEVVGRLGFIRAIVDMQMLPRTRQDLEAFIETVYALARVKAKAWGNAWAAEILTEAAAQEGREAGAAVYVTSDDLVKGPLSAASVWEWCSRESGAGVGCCLQKTVHPKRRAQRNVKRSSQGPGTYAESALVLFCREQT